MTELLKPITIITGHYGSGKTNIAVNLALSAAAAGKKVAVIDLDIVNPYFRTADFSELFEKSGIRLVSPLYANTNLDIPALTGAVEACLRNAGEEYVIVDVGGDDAGAIALGRYANLISQKGYAHFYVINCCRYLTAEAEDAVALLRDIEAVSHLKATGLINNSNLGPLTDKDTVLSSVEFARRTAEATGLPVLATAVKRDVAKDISLPGLFPVEIHVGTIWDRDE